MAIVQKHVLCALYVGSCTDKTGILSRMPAQYLLPRVPSLGGFDFYLILSQSPAWNGVCHEKTNLLDRQRRHSTGISARAFSLPSACYRSGLGADDLAANAARVREQFLKDFDPTYVDNVILPYFLVSTYTGERPALPMIGLDLSKENALPGRSLGLDQRELEAQPAGWGHGLSPGIRNADRTTAEREFTCRP